MATCVIDRYDTHDIGFDLLQLSFFIRTEQPSVTVRLHTFELPLHRGMADKTTIDTHIRKMFPSPKTISRWRR
jgi:hypothetical protein